MMSRTSTTRFLLLAAAVITVVEAFTPFSSAAVRRAGRYSLIELQAKAKKDKAAGQGFGKKEEATAASATPKKIATMAVEEPRETVAPLTSQPFLQSVDGGSTNVPELAPEERAKQLLRNKYGLKTLEEERLDQKQRDALAAQRKKLAEFRAKADAAAADDEFDLISLIPGDVLQAIYFVLKLGIGLTGTAFLLSGVGITIEAWSKASNSPLPENIDNFIVNIIEPNFTTELLVLLGCSISLGVLASLQLGSKSAEYREE